jgi:hypothetical protein
MLEAQQLAAESRARVDDDEDMLPVSSAALKAAIWIVAAIVVASLGHACSRSDGDSGPAGSERRAGSPAVIPVPDLIITSYTSPQGNRTS